MEEEHRKAHHDQQTSSDRSGAEGSGKMGTVGDSGAGAARAPSSSPAGKGSSKGGGGGGVGSAATTGTSDIEAGGTKGGAGDANTGGRPPSAPGPRATLDQSLALLQRSAQTLQRCDLLLRRSALLHFLARGSPGSSHAPEAAEPEEDAQTGDAVDAKP